MSDEIHFEGNAGKEERISLIIYCFSTNLYYIF